MKLQVSQLTPGYVLAQNVTGKTKQPIIKKNTVLTKEHILVLRKFLIETVQVTEHPARNKAIKDTKPLKETIQGKSDPFMKEYEHAVLSYKKHFKQWKNNMPLNMPAIRKFILPLLEYIDQLDIKVYQLYKYATAEDYIYYHDISVGILSAYLAKQLGYKKGEYIQIGLAGFLSNCGKAKLSTEAFMKGDQLTYLEKREIEKHPIHSFKLLESTPLIKEAVRIAILQHHERIDGSGYPLGTLADKIHPYAQVIAVCDIYYAMVSDRLYKERQSPFKVIETLKTLQNVKLDTIVVQTLMNDFFKLSLGKKVILSNFELGTITSIDDKRTLLLLEESQSIIALQDENELFIKDYAF